VRLQEKLACDTCGTSDVKLVKIDREGETVLLELICSLLHRTFLRLRGFV